ncbi:MAG: hypothetical protein ACW99A_12725 [Candidatus Kariarchaeaceae archaeon]|jgi:predicted nucleic acid-binding protein
MKISLDSTVFRDLDFIDWLYVNSEELEITVSVIVALETSYWYKLRGLDISMFLVELDKIKGKIDDLVVEDIDLITQNTIISNLKFRHHARDLIIGSHAQNRKSILITNNTRHFQWMEENVMNVDDFVLMFTDST